MNAWLVRGEASTRKCSVVTRSRGRSLRGGDGDRPMYSAVRKTQISITLPHRDLGMRVRVPLTFHRRRPPELAAQAKHFVDLFLRQCLLNDNHILLLRSAADNSTFGKQRTNLFFEWIP